MPGSLQGLSGSLISRYIVGFRDFRDFREGVEIKKNRDILSLSDCIYD